MAAPGVVCPAPAGARSRAAGRDRRDSDRYGSAGLSIATVHGVEPACALCCAVEQGRPARWNPDALLYLEDGSGTGAGARHYCVDPGGWHCSVYPPAAGTRCGQDRHSHPRNRPVRDHNDDRESPGSGTEHNRRVVHWGSWTHRADEVWCLARPGAIMDRLCESTVWGMASGRLSHLGWRRARSPRRHHSYRYSD